MRGIFAKCGVWTLKWTLLYDWILLSARLIGQKNAESIHLDNCRCKLDELMLDKVARLVSTNVVIALEKGQTDGTGKSEYPQL